jgi:hypothetical protein
VHEFEDAIKFGAMFQRKHGRSGRTSWPMQENNVARISFKKLDGFQLQPFSAACHPELFRQDVRWHLRL